ncbi:MAG: hybrid sensor histidine kinase/response regulator [Rubrivivax sp.]|nr:MAG: hybrid sensor histidine kinase/response regulator [Rubrivivax sp.]
MSGSTRDITERRLAVQSLQADSRKKDEFLAMLAHELRNPLSAVGNAVNVLKMTNRPESLAFATDVIQRQVKQFSRLIDDLLDVSRITSGKIRLQREPIDAVTVLRDAVESVRPLMEKYGHELKVELNSLHLPLMADATRIEQVVVNLLTNAAKYTEGKGRIGLSAGQAGGDVLITVSDNGIGIPPDKLADVFELFAQGERSIARSEGGLGVGLTIVKKLVQLHGGSVEAHSGGAGQGSTFMVRLPSGIQPDLADDSAPAQHAASADGVCVLVVDDNVDTANGLAEALELLGNEVHLAYDGSAALAAARAFSPSVVLLDIGLPGMDGYQVAHELRKDATCSYANIIAITGYGQEEDRRRSAEAGFNHHLVKPVDFTDLLSVMGFPGVSRPAAPLS